MIGAYNFVDVGNGLSFRIKNPKANYIKVTLNGKDLYDVEIGRIRGDKYTIVKEANDIYFDQLKDIIERGTGMYLSLFGLGGEFDSNDEEMAKGGLFDVSKNNSPTGSAWHKEHYNINKSEKHEVPLSERKVPARNAYAKGGETDEVSMGLLYVTHSEHDADMFEKLLDDSDYYAERDGLSFDFPVENWDVDVTEISVTEDILNKANIKGHWETYDKFAKGGKLSKRAKYVPNRMIQEIEVERNGKTTYIDGADIYDGIYVKKGVKYADGGMMADGGETEEEPKVIRGYSDDEPYEYAGGGLFDVSGNNSKTRGWTKEHYYYNKNEKHEVPPSERKHELRNRYDDGGMMANRGEIHRSME